MIYKECMVIYDLGSNILGLLFICSLRFIGFKKIYIKIFVFDIDG